MTGEEGSDDETGSPHCADGAQSGRLRPRSHIVEPVTTGSVVALVSRYGLLAVFGGTLLEGEGILIVAATLSTQGVLDPVRVWLTASTGAWLGHLFWFTTGRAIRGHRLALNSAALRARAAQVKRLIEVRPVTAILLLQYLYGVRLVGTVALGLTEFPLLRFVLYQIVNCLVWAGLIGGVGYLLGGLATEIFHGWFKWIWMVASAVLVILLFRFVGRLLDRIKA